MNDRSNQGAIVQNSSTDDRPTGRMSPSLRQWFEQFHGWDFLVSDAVEGKAEWKTNSRYSLNSVTLYERWKRPDQIVGVRFQTKKHGTTSYLMIDVDRASQYHPYINEEGLQAILRALESIGLCRFIAIRSSASEGIHLYCPLSKRFSCSSLALTVQHILKADGFEMSQGQLEIFPNVRSASRSFYQGHRLPLQTGSYVLDNNWQPLHRSLEGLIDAWELAANSQDVGLLEQAIAHQRQRHRAKDSKEWQLRLETTIREGWTDNGQTNRIVKDLCIYARVFERREWNEVEKWVLETAVALPGYKQFCKHQHQIQKRVKEWVTCNRKSKKYYPIGSLTERKSLKAVTNDVKKEDALKRIQEAIDAIKQNFGILPQGVKNRQKLICQQANCSAQTLYLYKSLWHPDFEDKGCVTLDCVRVLAVLDKSKKPAHVSSRCVTPVPARVSAISQASVKKFENR
jgi:hypothetical protein